MRIDKYHRRFSDTVLWYKTKEKGWISAQDYYFLSTKDSKLTVTKTEYHTKDAFYF